MANRGMPSLMALLGLLAVAGYQNRDKLGEMMRSRPTGTGTGERQGGFLDEIADMFGGGSAQSGGSGSTLADGLSSLVERFRTSGQGDVAESWISRGPNRGLEPADVERVVGASTVEDLAHRTGLSRDELLSRLASVLPDAVDRMTPEGRLPTPDEAQRFI